MKLSGCLAVVLMFVAATPMRSFAQNVHRIEEEAIKDKERETKLRQYLQEREQQERELLNRPITLDDLEKKNLVEVEPTNILPSDLVNNYSLVPYKIRRPRWGQLFSLTYSLYNPSNYESDYLSPTQGDFDYLYGTAEVPLFELNYTYKWNFALGSVGVDVGYGYYKNEAEDPLLGDATLTTHNLRIGARYTADAFALEPHIAPYAIGGIYQVIYSETQANASLDGTTLVAPYYGFGVMLQLGWLDPGAAVDAYTESGIENTFLFIEGRQYLASSQKSDPDFSTGLDVGGGLSLEF